MNPSAENMRNSEGKITESNNKRPMPWHRRSEPNSRKQQRECEADSRSWDLLEDHFFNQVSSTFSWDSLGGIRGT